MSEDTAVKYELDRSLVAAAQACQKGMCCLEQGPSCRIGATVNRNVLIVDCQDKHIGCPFFQAQSAVEEGESRGLCNCPVRHGLWEKYSL